MEKTATLNLRVDPLAKQSAENVLRRLGLSMSAAINLYLKQISLTGGIPFPIKLPEAPATIDAQTMTAEQIQEKLEMGYKAMNSGKAEDAETAFQKFRESHK